MALSTVPAGVATEALGYLREGGPENLRELARFLSDTVFLTGEGFDPPRPMPAYGIHQVTRARARGRPGGGRRVLPRARTVREHRLRRHPLRRPGRSTAPDRSPSSAARCACCWARRRGRRRARRPARAGRRGDHHRARGRRLGRRPTPPAEGDWDAGRAGQPGRAGAAGPVPDQLARAVGGLERRAGPDRRRDAGGDPRVRRPPDHRAVLVQGGRPGRDTPLRRRPRARRPAGRDRRPARPPGRHPERRQARRHHALLLSHQARPGGQRGRPGHPGVRRGAAAGHARGRLRPRRRLPRGRRHADPHADRGRRPRHRVAHRRPAPRRPGPGPARRLPPLPRESAERAGLVHPRTLGRPAG